jgi:hypothetical protein
LVSAPRQAKQSKTKPNLKAGAKPDASGVIQSQEAYLRRFPKHIPGHVDFDA